MNEPDRSIVTKIKELGTLTQIDFFGGLPPENRTWKILHALDGYARPRAFKFLAENLRTPEKLLELPDIDRWAAFEGLRQEFQTLENLKRLIAQEDQWRAFQFLSENERTLANLKTLPKSTWHCGFQFLNENDRTVANWERFSRSDREKAAHFLPYQERTRYRNISINRDKKIRYGFVAAGTLFAFLLGISLIASYFFFPPVALALNSVAIFIGLPETAALIFSSVVGSGVALAGIISSFFCIRKCARASKELNLLRQKPNIADEIPTPPRQNLFLPETQKNDPMPLVTMNTLNKDSSEI